MPLGPYHPGATLPQSQGQRRHVGSWIVTYSDMITLLMAFFICVITFSSHAADQSQKRDVAVLDGSGVPNATVWRLRFRQGSKTGAELAPLYQGPSKDVRSSILRALDGAATGKVGDSYVLHLPLDLLFGTDGKVTASGSNVLRAFANNLVDLPVDFLFRVPVAEQLPFAVQLCSFLTTCGIHPSRLAVGVRPEGEDEGAVWLVLTFQA